MTRLSKIHLFIAIVTFIFVTSLKGQVIQTKPEMIPYSASCFGRRDKRNNI